LGSIYNQSKKAQRLVVFIRHKKETGGEVKEDGAGFCFHKKLLSLGLL
jgi:hypothetical protein